MNLYILIFLIFNSIISINSNTINSFKYLILMNKHQ